MIYTDYSILPRESPFTPHHLSRFRHTLITEKTVREECVDEKNVPHITLIL